MNDALQAKHDELMAMASVLATKRVRRYAFHIGRAKLETEETVNRDVEQATHKLSLAIIELLETKETKA